MLTIWDLIGTFFFCVSGALAGRQVKFDYFGVFLMALVTGTGGGTLRSVLIGVTPPILTDPTYLVMAFVAVPVAVLFTHVWDRFRREVSVVDALGLGIFACIGTRVSMNNGIEWWAAIGLGVVSATFGGVIRDVLRNEVPLIFRKEIYATAALAGAGLMLVLDQFGIESQTSIVISALSVAVFRLIAIKFALNASEV